MPLLVCSFQGGEAGGGEAAGWEFSWREVQPWAEAVALHCPSLESYNGLQLSTIRADTLTVLDLSRRLIGGDGGLALAALLPGLQQLQTLVLTKCLLPEAATTAILDALRANPNDEAVATAQRDSLVADLEVRKSSLSITTSPCTVRHGD